LNWDAPWIDVTLRVELPFWLMVDDVTMGIEVGGHTFSVSLHGESFELHTGGISDAKHTGRNHNVGWVSFMLPPRVSFSLPMSAQLDAFEMVSGQHASFCLDVTASRRPSSATSS